MIKVIKDERRRKCDEHGMKHESDESNESTKKGLVDRRRFQSRTIFDGAFRNHSVFVITQVR